MLFCVTRLRLNQSPAQVRSLLVGEYIVPDNTLLAYSPAATGLQHFFLSRSNLRRVHHAVSFDNYLIVSESL